MAQLEKGHAWSVVVLSRAYFYNDVMYSLPIPQPMTESVGSALLADLNLEQRAAVTLPSTHALILAGAGSGKTRVLTTRIAWLLQTGQVASGGIMAVTFTNKAASEMTTRLQAMLPINVHGMWIGTFHGLCNRLLRAHHTMINLPQGFQILDTQDQLSSIKRVYKTHNQDVDRYPPKQMQWFIAGCKEDGLRPNAVPAKDVDTRKKIEIYQLYEDQCQREGVVDFGELILRSFELLRDNPAIRQHYRQRFRHILIDEFQDTNKLQYAWIKMMAGVGDACACGTDSELDPPSAVLAVGDDDQSIYAFRGARVGNMADFVREFGVQHQIKLEQNYRSGSHILDSANALIGHNSKRLGKNLRTAQGTGQRVRLFEAPSDLAEANWLVSEIGQLVIDGISRQEIAVLYRSNAQSRVIETALFQSGIPYKVYGGLRFFDRAEIKSALAYLRLLQNPHDDTSFMRVVNFPPRGIGLRSLEQLQDVAHTRACSLCDAVSGLGGKAGVHISAFVASINTLRSQTQGQGLREVMGLTLAHSGLIEHYQADKEGVERVANLAELINAGASFDVTDGAIHAMSAQPDKARMQSAAAADRDTAEDLSPLAAFLTHAALEAGDNQAQSGEDAVQLMTVHASKGLEFDGVFITGLEEGLFPNENAMGNRDGLEEERRLMYVAITRARKRLYISHSQTRMLHGQTRYNVQSRFIDELPESSLKWITPSRRAGGMRPGNAASWSAKHPAASERSPACASPSEEQTLKIGQKVFHAKFGQGTVLLLEGRASDARAQVQFVRHGVKWLALSVARLTPVP